MKWYHWVIIAVVGYVVLFRKQGTSSSGLATYGSVATSQASQAAAEAQILTTINELGNADAGFYGSTTHLTPAYTGDGWNPYPGWYRTDDGGWVNPDTGGTFAAGSSPEALAPPPSYTNPDVIDLSQGGGTVTGSDPYFIA